MERNDNRKNAQSWNAGARSNKSTKAGELRPTEAKTSDGKAIHEPSDCRKVVVTARVSDQTRQWQLDSWTAMLVMSACSVEPYTFDELASAVDRYHPRHRLRKLGERICDGAHVRPGALDADPDVTLCSARGLAELAEGGGGVPWCFIDFVGRTLVVGGGAQLPERVGAYVPDEGEACDGFPIVWFNAPSTWLFREAVEGWEALVQARAAEASAEKLFDVRPVLYGRPLLKHLVESVARAESLGDRPSAEDIQSERRNVRYRRTQRIHAEWLMTPRADLGGRTPREVIVSELDRVDRERENRAAQWGRQGFAPPPLGSTSRAYRFGGFGTTEAVYYFEMIRALLDDAWQIVEVEGVDADGLDGHLLEQNIAELFRRRDAWLAAPDKNSRSTTPIAEVIELERTWMPQIATSDEFDCDCPLCMEMAHSATPTFTWMERWCLDQENKFAFSLAATREEWESENGSWRRDDDDEDVDEGEDEGDDEFAGSDCLGGGEDASTACEAEYDGSSTQGASTTASTSSGGQPTGRSTQAARLQGPMSRLMGRVAMGVVEGPEASLSLSLSPRDGDQTVWRRSYVGREGAWDGDSSGVAPVAMSAEMASLSIGFRLAEFASELKMKPEGRDQLPALNQAYLRFRQASHGIARRVAGEDLARRLEAATLHDPALAPRSADLQSLIDEVLRM